MIIFVGDVDRCYRVKLFLEQFGIKSCVLNSELPINSRLHVVEEFNKGVYDIIVAADDQEVMGAAKSNKTSREAADGEDAEGKEEIGSSEDEEELEASGGKQKSRPEKRRKMTGKIGRAHV